MLRIYITLIIILFTKSSYAQVRENTPLILTSQQQNYPCLFLKSEFYVIRKNKEYRDEDYLDIDWDDKSCKRVNYPKIDFKKNILVGLRKYVRSCDMPTMKYEITKQEERNVKVEIITLDVEFTTNGNCQVEYECIYWFLLPIDDISKHDSFELKESYTNVD